MSNQVAGLMCREAGNDLCPGLEQIRIIPRRDRVQSRRSIERTGDGEPTGGWCGKRVHEGLRQIQAHDAVLVEPHAACLDRVAYQSSQCRVQEGTSPLSWLSPQFFSFVDPDGEVEQLIGKVFAELSK